MDNKSENTQTRSKLMEQERRRRSRRAKDSRLEEYSDQIVNEMAKLLNKIDSEIRWPSSAEVVPRACLSNIGKHVVKQGEVRPVALLPILYRIWSSVTDEQMEKWLRTSTHELALSSKQGTWSQQTL